jgi:uncharacterized protein YecT (DUF1311 family)
MPKYWKILVIPLLVVLALRGSWKADPKIEAARLEAIEAARELSTASSFAQTASMAFIPTDAIARETPDSQHIDDLRLKRFSAVESLLMAGFPDLAQPSEAAITLLAPFCPRIGSMSKSKRQKVFSFLLDLNTHEIPFLKSLEIPVVDFSKMSKQQVDRHLKDFGDQMPLRNKAEVYAFAEKFKAKEIEDKAKAMLNLFSAKTVTATELIDVLTPQIGQQKSFPNEVHERSLTLQLSGLRVCSDRKQDANAQIKVPVDAQSGNKGTDHAKVEFTIPQRIALSSPLNPAPSSTPAPPPSAAPSFACTGQLQPAEVSICNNEDLAKRDVQLVGAYQKLMALAANDDQRASLKTEQRSWLVSRNACGSAVACLTSVYRGRQAEFALALKPVVASSNVAPPQKTILPKDGEAKDIRRVSSDVSGGILNLRAAPNVQGQLLLEIPAGSGRVVVESCQPKTDAKLPWCKVRWNNTSGWVSSGGLRK